MAVKIRISGDIGFDVTTEMLLQQMDAAAGADLDILVDSPGGSVFEGISLYDAVLDYHRKYPNAAIYIAMKGLAASMASYLMMVSAAVGGMSAAEENSAMMIHLPWNIAIGSWKDMQKNADFLKGLSQLMAKAYIRQTEKSAEDIDAIMADETWLFGQQIKDAGFVDEIIPAEDPAQQSDAAAAISSAKLKYQAMQARAKNRKENPDRVAAIMRQVLPAAQNMEPKNNLNPPAVGGKESTPSRGNRGKSMDPKEIQAQHPEAYAEILAAGVKQGVTEEGERVKKSLALMEKPEIKKRAGIAKRIRDGIEKGEGYAEILLSATAMLTDSQESPEDIATGSVDTPTGEVPKGAEGSVGKDQPAWTPGQAGEV